MNGKIEFSTHLVQVMKTPQGPCVVRHDGHRQVFDAVVLATHADQARALLSNDADLLRKTTLAAFGYQPNEAFLHTDASQMPRRRRLWSSWNYHGRGDDAGDQSIALTYWMNRLQGLRTREQVFVTLNPTQEPDPKLVQARIAYDHPQFDFATIQAQERLRGLQGRDGIWFCGSYTGYGFHEDGLRSGLEVADSLGAPAPWWSEYDRVLAEPDPRTPPLAEAA